MHWHADHFSAVIARTGDRLLLDDPQLGGKNWYDARWLDRQASGYFLVPASQLDEAWLVLSEDEAARIQGGQRIYPPRLFDEDDEECPSDEEITSQPMDPEAPRPGELTPCPLPETCPPGHGEEECDGRGMPVWRVSEPFINLWVKDVPLYYTMSNGRLMPLVLRYKQRGSPLSTNVFGFGNSWECSWLSYFEVTEDNAVTFRVPGGGKRRYDGALDGAVRGARSELVGYTLNGDGTVGYRVAYRSSCASTYNRPYAGTETNTLTLLTEKYDPHGRVIRFEYSTNENVIRLSRVIDYDGKTSELSYTNRLFPRFVTSVRDPYGRQAHFHYDTNGNLARIIDIAGITNAFAYNRDGFLEAMLTPYGTTRFRSSTAKVGADGLAAARFLEATLPNADRQAYAYYETLETSQVPDYYPDCPQVDVEVPEPLSVGPLNRHSSFFWDTPQLALVTNEWPVFSHEHYRLARWRYWNVTLIGEPRLGTRLLMERSPSPDGFADGHRRWYSYFYDPFSGVNTVWPSQQAERLPDGTVRYVRWERNEWGLPLSVESTYSDGPAVAVRRTWLGYDSSGCRLTEVYGPELDEWQWPILNRAYAYNLNGQITNTVNALGETTSATYNFSNRNLTGVTYPFGLRITNGLASDGFLARRIWLAANGAPLATNSFQWQQGRVRTTTDARGLQVTHFWDALGRLTGRGYPDGTTISNWYVKVDGVPFAKGTGGLQLLDRTRFKDRLGNLTAYAYNARRQTIAVTNALGRSTRYTWCDCGALGSVTDPLGQTTSLAYDLQGRLAAIHFPGGSRLQLAYDYLGRATNLTAGVSALSLGYNNQGLRTTLATAAGIVQHVEYDAMNRPRWVELPTGVQYDFGYDWLGRLTRRTERQSQGTEWLSYSPGIPWPTGYTNQLGSSVLLLAYDALGRLTRQTQGTLAGGAFRGLTTNQFSYSPAGDLLSLLDGLDRRTSWTYDLFGRPSRKLSAAGRLVWTNAYDANHQLIAHWTPARSNLTRYLYDPLGQLTKVDFSAPATTDLTFAYDAAGRLITTTDALGTTRFAWSPLGTLTREDGPWAGDAVSFEYDPTRALRALSLDQPHAPSWVQTFAYDTDGRLARLASPAGAFTYAYRGSDSLVTSISRLGGGTVTQDHDELGRLLDTTLLDPAATVLNRHLYEYDLAHQRTRQTFTDGNVMDYAYDPLGQLTTALGSEGSKIARHHEQLAYRYDAAGNLTNRQNGSATLRLAVDPLNQLGSATRGAAILVAGMTTPSATNVTVNGQLATLYQDRTFVRTNLPLADVSTTLTAIARDALGRSASDTLSVNLPGSVTFTYDANGNLVRDARRLLTFDDRDQLVALIVTNGVNDSTLSEFFYDAFGRRRLAREKTWQTNQWVQTAETRYVYAGSLVLQERGEDNEPRVTYTRGPDLSGDFQQAGGIGGLLALTRHSPIGADHLYYHADGSGNITALIDAQHHVVARYRYDPFGNLQGLAGPLADANLIRFSSKEFHPPSSLVYFGYRYYDPNLQRWINQDPIAENGGLNLARFVGNNPIAFVDPFGLFLHPYQNPGFPWLPGPETYVYGDKWWENWFLAAPYNTAQTFWNGLYWAGVGVTAAADSLGGFIQYVEAKLGAPGLTEALPLLGPGVPLLKRSKAIRAADCPRYPSVFRQGTFADETKNWNGNYVKGQCWASDNPLTTPDYARKYGLPAANSGKPDWVAKGKVVGPYKTRPAGPSFDNPENKGGATEVFIEDPASVVLEWFHMPD